MQGNARGMYASACIVPVKGRGLLGECKGVGVKYWRNERECRGMAGERTRVEAVQENAGERRGMQGNTVEHRGKPRERMGVESARGMLGNAG